MKRIGLALLAVLLTAVPAWALDPDELTIENPIGTNDLQFKINSGSGDIALASTQCAFQADGIVCEGATANAFETRIVITDPTAERTITFPDATGTVLLVEDQNAGTDVTADLEEETHASEHASAFLDASGETLVFKDTDTLAGNPALGAEECVFSNDSTGGVLLCEGSAADAFEGLLVWNPTTADRTVTIPDATGTVVLADAAQTLTNKTIDDASNTLVIDAASITTGTLPVARIGADTIDAVSEIAAGIKTNDSATKIMMTSAAAPGSAECVQMDTDGSFSLTGAACGGAGLTTSRQTFMTELKVNLPASGKIYVALGSGQLCDTEADCRIPYEDANSINFLDCSMSASQDAAEVTYEVDVQSCTGAAWTFTGSTGTISATANDTADGSDAASTGGANLCANMVVENTDVSNPLLNRAYLKCSYQES